MVETQLIKRTLTDQVADQLRQDIRSGLIAPGSRLRQRDVAERYGVSITPVREAFAQLEREGLLVSSPHRGVLVFHPTAEDLDEIYEIRIPLEVIAARKAAVRITADELHHLETIVDTMRNAMTDDVRYTQLNREFHLTIYAAARRPRLQKMIADLRDSSSAYLRLFTELLPTAEQSQRDHETILAALKAHDPEQAGQATARHLQETLETVTARLANDHDLT